jgi:hypothetical protein
MPAGAIIAAVRPASPPRAAPATAAATATPPAAAPAAFERPTQLDPVSAQTPPPAARQQAAPASAAAASVPRSSAAKCRPRQGTGPDIKDDKLMSERYRKSLSWPEQQDRQVTRADKATWTHAISKHKVHKGMRRAVKHLQEQLLLHTTLWLQSATAPLPTSSSCMSRQSRGRRAGGAPGPGPAAGQSGQPAEAEGQAVRQQDGLQLGRRVEPVQAARRLGAACRRGSSKQRRAERQAAQGRRRTRVRDAGPDSEAGGHRSYAGGSVPPKSRSAGGSGTSGQLSASMMLFLNLGSLHA